MTAALAKEMGLSVRYQAVLGDDAWDRAGDLYVSVGHVNLTLGDRPPRPVSGHGKRPDDDRLRAAARCQRLRTRLIAEHTVVAMYLNNRAVESLALGKVDEAYWWAREADAQRPGTAQRLHHARRDLPQPAPSRVADRALQRVLAREPDNTKAMSNRVLVLRDLGRQAEAGALLQQLQRLDPHPPYSYFHAGMAALRERRLEAARALFQKEVDRAPYQHEFSSGSRSPTSNCTTRNVPSRI